MDKLLTYAGYDQTGPHIFSLDDDPRRILGHVKMARSRALPGEVEHYIKQARPIPGKTQLLIDALGSSDYWGSNVNGDWFPEKALAHKGDDYGHRTFMRYGHPFKHHVNKDPARAYGDRVTLSSYDPDMHRVLLIVRVHNDKCDDILNDLANNKYWDVSMGCRVPWDECSVCKNRARNRAEYCPHLRYQMNKILPDGRRVCAYNWLPKFFDISFVLVGAEKASHVLKKVAYDDRRPYEIRSSTEAWQDHLKAAGLKVGSTNKSATMNKRIDMGQAKVQPVDGQKDMVVKRLLDDASYVKGQERELPEPTQELLSKFPLREVFATLSAMGIILRPEEFQRLIFIKMGKRQEAEKLAARRIVFDETEIGPAPAWAKGFDRFDPSAVSEKVALAMRPFMADRSVYPEILAARLDRFEKEAKEKVTYERNSPWWPMNEEEMRASSGEHGAVPASLALASAYIAYKNVLPAILGKGAMSDVLKKSWFLPILLGAGVGTSVGLSVMSGKRPLGEHEKLSSVDAIGSPQYDTQKTAAPNAALMRLGVPAAVYAYAGIRRNQAQRGRRLGSIDRAIALNPGWAALIGYGLTPNVLKGIKTLSKNASIGADLGLYALGSPRGFMPGIMAAGLLDSLIFRGIARLASRNKRKAHGTHTR